MSQDASPTWIVITGNLAKDAAVILTALEMTKVVYLYNSKLVMVTPKGAIEELTAASMTGLVSKVGVWGKMKKAAFKECLPPMQLLNAVLAYPYASEYISKLTHVTASPTLVLDCGTLRLLERGYCGGVYVTTNYNLPYVSCVDAPKIIMDLFRGCNFSTLGDVSRAVAAVMTPALRQVTRMLAPIHCVSATHAGAGKGYLLGLTYSPYRIRSSNITIDGPMDRLDDKFFGALARGMNHITIDNVRSMTQTAVVESATTEGEATGRGAYQKQTSYDMYNVQVAMTANSGVVITQDMYTRLNLISLDRRTGSTVGHRQSDGSIPTEVANKTLAAIYAIVSHWYFNGRKRDKASNRYQDWSGICNHIVTTYFKLPRLDSDLELATNQLRISENLRLIGQIGRSLLAQGVNNVTTSAMLDIMIETESVPCKLGAGDKVLQLAHYLNDEIKLCRSEAIDVDGIIVTRGRVRRSKQDSKTTEGWVFRHSEDTSRNANKSSSVYEQALTLACAGLPEDRADKEDEWDYDIDDGATRYITVDREMDVF